MWEVRAEYADGTEIQLYFNYDPQIDDNEQQYLLEFWLLERHPDCIWYSVNYCIAETEDCNDI